MTTNGHSGYYFPWDATELYPFRTSAHYHEYHHSGNIDSNYGGGLYLLDYLFDSCRDYYAHLKMTRQFGYKSD